MIYGLGVDLVQIDRLQRAINRWGERLVGRLFTAQEVDYCKRKKKGYYHSLAGKFAAKEALWKALGAKGFQGLSWKNLEVLSDPQDKPYFAKTEALQKRLAALGIKGVFLSITHTREHALALVILTKE
ncbi:holo-[acyl-carrier-protein] synthase [bacterium (candidate division B38) B3_B38]|nr:MAG: holo-[acyl-carrier-protein] synthase [bacterium (candidate division B38) B3_B38]